jgi:hypothetical protein
MSKHIDRTAVQPSRLRVAFFILVTLWYLGLSHWLWWGDVSAEDLRGWATILGFTAATMALAEVFGLLIQRQDHQRATSRELIQHAWYTGTWGDLPGQPGTVLTVRWDPEGWTYWVSGWVSDNWQITGERRWDDVESLTTLIEEAERDGLLPADDAATRMVRARLGVPRWNMNGLLHD